MFKLLVLFVLFMAITGTIEPVVNFFLVDPFRILALFVALFLLVPMTRLVLGK